MIVEFLVNGGPGSAIGVRAERIAACFDAEKAHITYRAGNRTGAVASMAKALRRADPRVVYAMDLAVAPVVASFVSPRVPLIVDTGDAPFAFLTLVGAPVAQRAAAWVLERTAYGHARRVIVRGPHHADALRAGKHCNVTVVPDGVDLEVFHPDEDRGLRARMGLDGVTTIGLQGYFTWYPKLGGGLGWDLVELLARRPDLALRGVLIGDGPGMESLRAHARERNVLDRLVFCGRVPHAELPKFLSLCDICLLTQTNDPSSQVRTTGKLPGYMACGRYVLASRVGTAADLLPDDMLVGYEGAWDASYPDKLGERVESLIADPDYRRAGGEKLCALAQEFDYDTIARRCADVVREVAA